MDVEEKLGREMSYEDEIALLQRESEMSVEELRAMYEPTEEDADVGSATEDDADVGSATEEDADVGSASDTLASLEQAIEDQENDDEFLPDAAERDDETTIEAEERLGREMSPEAELALLQQESEIPVDSLRSMYQASENDEEDEEEDAEEGLTGRKRKRESKESESEEGGSDAGNAANDALSTLEESAERARKTKATRPYLLSPWVELREYQQVGLNWLVSLQSRRLNGILAGKLTQSKSKVGCFILF
jgi:SNF2 family DNA or RNA helicase